MVALYRRLARAVLPPLTALAASGCATASELLLKYCEDEDGRITSCDCDPAPREVLGGHVGHVDVSEYATTPRGVDARHYRIGRDLQFVLRGRWFVIEVKTLSGPATSLLAWLRCDGYVLPAETLHRDTVLGEWDVYTHQFLALFPAADPDDLSTPRCQLNIALVGNYEGGLLRRSESVYLINRTSHYPVPVADATWTVSIREAPALPSARVRENLDPPPPPPQPRLCRGAATTTSTIADPPPGSVTSDSSRTSPDAPAEPLAH